jgi:hypothetical protein
MRETRAPPCRDRDPSRCRRWVREQLQRFAALRWLRTGLLAARERRRLLDRDRRRDPVADQIHAAMDLVKSAHPHAPLDLFGGHAGGQELPARNHSVLAGRNRCDYPVR